ncbi:MAG: hypothetical protein V2A58_08150 [Planctomycetota bacterium]
MTESCKKSNGFVESLSGLVGKEVVIDTATSYIFLGRLIACTPSFVTLEDADVRDSNEGRASKDHYAFEASRYGYRKIRKQVVVRVEQIVSISRLEDVLG